MPAASAAPQQRAPVCQWRRRRILVLRIAGALTVLAAIDLLATGMVLPRYAFNPLRGRWGRWPTQRDWGAAVARKQSASRAPPLLPLQADDAPLPVWVLSLPGAHARRTAMWDSWIGAGIKFVDAIDGAAPLPDGMAKRYMSRIRLAHAAAGDQWEAAKIAIDLSHLMLATRMLQRRLPVVVVLEDDVAPTEGRDGAATLRELRTAMARLPEDWDILYLTGASCRLIPGAEAAPGIRIATDCVGTYAYAVRPRFARVLLSEAAAAPGTLIDLLFGALIASQRVAAYAFEPPLVRHVGNVSTYGTAQGAERRAGLPFYKIWRLEGRK